MTTEFDCYSCGASHDEDTCPSCGRVRYSYDETDEDETVEYVPSLWDELEPLVLMGVFGLLLLAIGGIGNHFLSDDDSPSDHTYYWAPHSVSDPYDAGEVSDYPTGLRVISGQHVFYGNPPEEQWAEECVREMSDHPELCEPEDIPEDLEVETFSYDTHQGTVIYYKEAPSSQDE